MKQLLADDLASGVVAETPEDPEEVALAREVETSTAAAEFSPQGEEEPFCKVIGESWFHRPPKGSSTGTVQLQRPEKAQGVDLLDTKMNEENRVKLYQESAVERAAWCFVEVSASVLVNIIFALI
eukprot:Protomagalhaensia_sp_Gyna_25__2403@NODE_2335_length_1142_cov_2_223028_g1936_i0_p1_GENE_NODE_2335_length_1142_cov_2_223028_g1936_i0NODE_2335_length_1142_cov_2_223028_g1936_i0_p1_ORF_typecomplete_len125_score35_58Leu_Phe_trans/PF03588_14/0_22_NODE_2335_length_1142_cov_2_223028_g1936_i051425